MGSDQAPGEHGTESKALENPTSTKVDPPDQMQMMQLLIEQVQQIARDNAELTTLVNDLQMNNSSGNSIPRPRRSAPGRPGTLHGLDLSSKPTSTHFNVIAEALSLPMHGGGQRAGYLHGYGQPSPYSNPHGTGHPSGYPQEYGHPSPTSDSQRTAKLRDRNAGDRDPDDDDDDDESDGSSNNVPGPGGGPGNPKQPSLP